MSNARILLIGALAWSAIFLLSAYWLRGLALGDWLEGFLLVAWFAFSSCLATRSRCARA